jgi:hypothetical protein
MKVSKQNGRIVVKGGKVGVGTPQECCCNKCFRPCDEDNPPLEGCQPICGWPKYSGDCELIGEEGCGLLDCVLSWDTAIFPGEDCEVRHTFYAPVQDLSLYQGTDNFPIGVDCGGGISGLDPGWGYGGFRLGAESCQLFDMNVAEFGGTTSCACAGGVEESCTYVVWNATYSCSNWNCPNQCCDEIEVDLFFEVPDGINCDCPEKFVVENVVLTCT